MDGILVQSAQPETEPVVNVEMLLNDIDPVQNKISAVNVETVAVQAGTDQIATGCHGSPPVQDSRIGELFLNKLQLKLQMFY